MRYGDAGIFGNGNGAGYARYKFKGQSCFQKLNGFFAAAAKYKGVAAFKAGNGFAFSGKFYQQFRMVWLAEALPT